jgi:thiosulfate dehydrogenase [quinone] large subunit
MNALSIFIARIVIATSMMGHGIVRIPKLQAFSDGMVASFKNSMMPEIMVRPFSYTVPFVELLIGILLLIGLFRKYTLILAAIYIIALIIGSCLIEKWDWVAIQMFYGLYFAILLSQIDSDPYSLDSYFKINR